MLKSKQYRDKSFTGNFSTMNLQVLSRKMLKVSNQRLDLLVWKQAFKLISSVTELSYTSADENLLLVTSYGPSISESLTERQMFRSRGPKKAPGLCIFSFVIGNKLRYPNICCQAQIKCFSHIMFPLSTIFRGKKNITASLLVKGQVYFKHVLQTGAGRYDLKIFITIYI